MQEEMREQGKGGPYQRPRHIQEMEHRYTGETLTVSGVKITEGSSRE